MATTTGDVVRLDDADGTAARRRLRALYIAFSTIISAVVLFAAAEQITGWHGYGMDHHTVRASGRGYELEVHYATVTRGGLATPLSVTVRRDAPITEPLTMSVSQDYFDAFLSSGVEPVPSSETSTGADLVLTLDPPGTDELTVDWDMTARPAGWFTTHHADVSVLDTSGQPAATVRISTGIRP